MNDLSIIASIGVGCLIGGIIFWQYKQIKKIKAELESEKENSHQYISEVCSANKSMEDRIQPLQLENCELQIQLDARTNDLQHANQSTETFRTIIMELLILYHKIRKVNCDITELEYQLLRITSSYFKFTDVEPGVDFRDKLYEDVPQWATEIFKDFKEKVLSDYYVNAYNVTQSTGAGAAPGDQNCMTIPEKQEG